MVAQLLNGEALAKEIRTQITEQIALRSQAGLRPPKLSVILVGDDDASTIYVRLKRRDCHEIGIQCDVLHFSHSTSEERLCQTIRLLNSDPENDGILLQLPLPPHISPLRVIELIDPTKDVDGITPHNMGMLTMREPAHRCCTPKGVMSLLSTTGKELRGSHACVIGASNHVGRPMCLELLLVGCTVTVTHKFTRDTPNLVTQADIVVSATGKAKLVTANWIKPGAIVIDVGIERQKDGSISGDVDFESVKQVAGWITPVPGGVGPMTRVSILQNLMDAVAQGSS